jgi:hypothetical protein
MFIACIGYVSYAVFTWILLRSVIADMCNNGHPVPLLVSYNESCMLNKQSQTDEYRESSNFEVWAWTPRHNMACYDMLHEVWAGGLLWTC